MMPSRVQSIELNIKHVGYPCQGMPVCGVIGSECPADTFHRYAILNMGVFCHIDGIIVISEIAGMDLPECDKGGNSQGDVNY